MAVNARMRVQDMAMEKKYWLFKSEPNVFSINNLERATGKTTCWDGVRNYQARNYLRDEVAVVTKFCFTTVMLIRRQLRALLKW